MPSSFTMQYSNKNTAADVILKASFTTEYAIPAGYDNVVNGTVGDKGVIRVEFDIYSAFPKDLGDNTRQTGDSFPCYGITGITGNLSCIITIGDDTLTRPSPTIIEITGFNAISANTAVSIHFPKLKNGSTNGF
mmetsp:Transcript_26284/g.4542  ORF Transcript_26284/g.4542 Transcript_26284/m.4542 type:complete len:134 (+) Transcript_26284:2986-3387(+)